MKLLQLMKFHMIVVFFQNFDLVRDFGSCNRSLKNNVTTNIRVQRKIRNFDSKKTSVLNSADNA